MVLLMLSPFQTHLCAFGGLCIIVRSQVADIVTLDYNSPTRLS